MVVVHTFHRQRQFTLHDDSPSNRIQLGTKLCRTLRHRVEKDTVNVQIAHRVAQQIKIVPTLPSRSCIPGVVINKHLHIMLVQLVDHLRRRVVPPGISR